MKALLLTVWIGGCGADAASTHYGLTHGGQEVILSQSVSANYAVMSGEALYGVWALNKLHRTHPKLATAIGIGAGIARAGLAAHNLRVTR